MNIELPLDQMTLAEKISLMENIWDDLCRHEGGVPSPDWHGKLLEKREQDISTGKAHFMDWNDAKRTIRGVLP